MSEKHKILIVDDDSAIRDTLEALLFQEGYDLAFAENGSEALEKASELMPDLILLDVMMPDMDGFEVCRRLRADQHLAEVPVVILTALDDRDSRLEGIEAGADDFLNKPTDRTDLRLRVRNITKLNRYRHLLTERAKFKRLIELSPDGIMAVDYEGKINLANPAMMQLTGAEDDKSLIGKNIFSLIIPDQIDECSKAFESVINGTSQVMQIETQFNRTGDEYFPIELKVGFFEFDDKPGVQVIIRDITIRKQAQEEIQRMNKEMADTQEEVIFTLGEVVETRSKETANHVRRVAGYSHLIAVKAGLSQESAEMLRMASPMHDVGKIGIPDSILLKPGKLTHEEFEQMKTHTSIGHKILKNSDREMFRAASVVAHQHHEKWNGKGYPRGLKEDKIHIYGRITGLADVFDALGSDRCYKKAWKIDRILELIKEERGEHFDPHLVDVFLENIDRFIEIQQRYPD
ncbi:response regulator [Desulfococcaceae bacterium HSG8]|nr:response regulator [Desulfococcaceae bacterium HSG8]